MGVWSVHCVQTAKQPRVAPAVMPTRMQRIDRVFRASCRTNKAPATIHVHDARLTSAGAQCLLRSEAINETAAATRSSKRSTPSDADGVRSRRHGLHPSHRAGSRASGASRSRSMASVPKNGRTANANAILEIAFSPVPDAAGPTSVECVIAKRPGKGPRLADYLIKL